MSTKLLLVLEFGEDVPDNVATRMAARAQERATAFMASDEDGVFVLSLSDGVKLARVFGVGDVPIKEITIKTEREGDAQGPKTIPSGPPPPGFEDITVRVSSGVGEAVRKGSIGGFSMGGRVVPKAEGDGCVCSETSTRNCPKHAGPGIDVR
jgi:hypothetical protein